MPSTRSVDRTPTRSRYYLQCSLTEDIESWPDERFWEALKPRLDDEGRDRLVTGPNNLVGRPLNEVERYYIAQTLALTEGNREEAARRLGIGERTLYRTIQDWKLQDKIQSALTEAGGDPEQAARKLGMKEDTMRRKIKKWGMQLAE